MNDLEVKELQKFLNNHNFRLNNNGAGSPSNETTYFGSLTKQALIKFQQANDIEPANGFMGPITRKLINNFLN